MNLFTIQETELRDLRQATDIIIYDGSKTLRFLFYILAGFMLFIFLWVSITTINERVAASHGVIKTEGDNLTIQAAASGRITEILVKEGDEVKKGQPLLRLDGHDVSLEIKSILEQISNEEENLQVASDQKNNLLTKSKADLNQEANQIKSAQIQIEQLEALKDQLLTELEQYNIKSHYNEKNLRRSNELFKAGLVSEIEINKLKLEAELIKKEIERFQKKIREYSLSIENAEVNLTRSKKELESLEAANKIGLLEVESRINNIPRRIETNKNQLAVKQYLKDNLNVLSPADGVIVKLNYNTPGSVLNPSVPVAVIAPSQLPLIVESYLLNKDISKVKLGQKAQIKLASYPHQEYGVLRGVVSYISPDSFSDPNLGKLYRLEMTLIHDTDNNIIELKNGMTCEVEIIVNSMSIFKLLAKKLKLVKI